jgi:hypothetical protein
MKLIKTYLLVLVILVISKSICFSAVMGDANGNGRIDLGDSMFILQTLVGMRPEVLVEENTIVGSWYGTNIGNPKGTVSITFTSDGTYNMAFDGSSADDPSGQPGIERGTYEWDAMTDNLQITVSTDTNGDWGFNNSATLPASINLTTKIIGKTLSLTGSDESSINLTRVTNANVLTPSIIGSWYSTNIGKSTGFIVITFTSDGTYIMAFDGSSADDPSGQPGIERGTYEWDAMTDNLQVTVSTDTNGDWGFNNNATLPADINIRAKINISGNTLTLGNVGKSTNFGRVLP